MGLDTKYKEVGGGPATGLATDFVNMLRQGLFGSFGGPTAGARMAGANPYAQSMGVAGVLNDILAGGAGQLGGSLGEMMSRQAERDVAGLRSRFGMTGGMGFGTPAAFAESMYRAEAAPRAALAVGGLQMQALQQLLPVLANISGRGISQREVIAQPGTGASILATVAPIVGTVLGAATGGPPGAAAGATLGSQLGGSIAGPSGPVGNGRYINTSGGSYTNLPYPTPAMSSPMAPGLSPSNFQWDPSVFQLPSWSPTWSLN